jgi:uncharacterized protein (TIGR02391 family)
MANNLALFERITRRAYRFTQARASVETTQHPFEARDIHPRLPSVVKDLFDDGHFAQATFEAFKFLDKEVQRYSGSSESGMKLMMQAFAATSPLIKLNSLSNTSESDEQKGYQFLFAGGILAIRNPRGHEYAVKDDPDTCLDHLSFVSMLLRRLSDAGYTL